MSTERDRALERLASNALVRQLRDAIAAHAPIEAAEDGSAKLAAILLVLHLPEGAEEPSLLLIRRAEFEGDPWSGHVACPGGRAEPGDRNLEETATRETLEETGLDIVQDGVVIGQLDDLSPRTPYLPPIVIRPFVALLLGDARLRLSHEVASAFWVPLSAVLLPAAWVEGPVDVRGAPRTERIFEHAGHVVWGLTERVLRQFASLFAPPG